MSVVLTGSDLSIDELVMVAREGERVELAADVRARMTASHAVVERSLHEGAEVYGLSTAVGVLKRVDVAAAAAEYSREVLRSHRVGQGPVAPRDLVRATMVRLANAYAAGTNGVRPELADRIIEALDRDEVPPVRSLGSVGQADLAPMADLAAGLFGDRRLEAGEGLALVSSNAFSTAMSALAIHDADLLLDAATAAGALSLEGLRANLSLMHPGIGRVRPYPGLQRALSRLHAALEGSALHEPGVARNLQDPLTFRNLPHMLGALEDALAYARAQVAIELNASDSNPILLPGEPTPVSVANFESLPVAAAVDHVRLVLGSVLTASGERAVKLLETPWSGLPTGLVETYETRVPRPGLPGDRGPEPRGRGATPRSARIARGRLDLARRGHRGPHDHGAPLREKTRGAGRDGSAHPRGGDGRGRAGRRSSRSLADRSRRGSAS